MPENANQNQTQNANAEAQTSSEQDSSAALETTGFKWGANAPAEWQGKPAEYAIQERQQLVSALQQLANAAQAVQAQPAARLPDPDLAMTDPSKWQQEYSQAVGSAIQSQIGQYVGPVLQSQAETAKRLATANPKYADVFKRWGHEVELLVNSPAVPAALRANPATWEQASRIVKGEHADEIATERAKVIATELSNTEVAGTGGGFSPTPEARGAMEKISASPYGKYLEGRGYKPRDIQRICDQRGITMEKFADECSRANIIQEKPGSWKSQIGKNVAGAKRG